MSLRSLRRSLRSTISSAKTSRRRCVYAWSVKHRYHSRHFQIIPRAIDYFTGKALEYEDFDDDEDDFEDIEDDEDDEDEFEDDVCLYPVPLSSWP